MTIFFLERKRYFVHHIGGGHRGRGKNYEHSRALGECVLHGTIPPLTGPDVQLIQPDGGSRRSQIPGETQGEVRVFAGIAEKAFGV
jgi:hypothetical protein